MSVRLMQLLCSFPPPLSKEIERLFQSCPLSSLSWGSLVKHDGWQQDTCNMLAIGLFGGESELPSTNTFVLLFFDTDFINAFLNLNLEHKVKKEFQSPAMAMSANR